METMTSVIRIKPDGTAATQRVPIIDWDPSWDWPDFANFRSSVYDWEIEPELQRSTTIFDRIDLEAIVMTPSPGFTGRVLESHVETANELDLPPTKRIPVRRGVGGPQIGYVTSARADERGVVATMKVDATQLPELGSPTTDFRIGS